MAKFYTRIFPLLLLQLQTSLLIAETSMQSCENCGCCVNNVCGQKHITDGSNSYYVTEFCTHGCVSGIWGERCYNPCKNQCTSCDQKTGTICKESCAKGKYLGYGGCLSCNARCKSCTSATQCQECNDSYYNDGSITDCSLSCPGNCLCQNNVICSSCKDGSYNTSNECQNTCPSNCKKCTSFSNCQSCKDGFYLGNNNEAKDCSLPCPVLCSKCSSNNYCTHCNTGRYGNTCQSKCSVGCVNEQCNIENGICSCVHGFTSKNCSECIPGRYSDHCDKTCSSGCKDDVCERSSGRCIECKSKNFVGGFCDRCVAGKWNSHCASECPIRCNESNCDRGTGNCYSCEVNFDGDKCDHCIAGHYGANCELKCPENCENLVCHQSNGTCLSCKHNFAGKSCDECVAGWSALNCNIPCSAKNCFGNICNRNTGKCSSCSEGFYGSLCELSCSPGCYNESCDFVHGTCFGCAASYSGDKCCIKDDNGHCLTCSSNSTCKECVNGFYGMNCSKSCPPNCSKNEQELRCDKISGNCSSCDLGFYGGHCDRKCSDKCSNSRCIQGSGHCVEGCADINFGGPTCTEAVKRSDTTDIAPLAGGGVTASIIIIVIVVIVIFVFRRRRPHAKHHERLTEDDEQSIAQLPSPSPKPDSDSETYYSEIKLKSIEIEEDTVEVDVDDTMPQAAQNEDTVYENVATIYVSGLEAYVKRKSKADYKQEFEQLPMGITQSCNDARKEENVVKVRYKGVCPYDHSRVKLKGDPEFFINACYIDGFQAPNGYIASVGPTEKATDMFYSFWKMVWHVNSDVIVMLTNLHEPSGKKCDQYWPNMNCTNTHQDITVSCRSIEVFAQYTVRTFTVEKTSRKRTVYQFHFTVWPDKSVPDEVTSLVEFRQRVRSMPSVLQGPVIVHCSAGVGRTGTYIALDRLTETGEAGERINVYGCVYQMRQQRVNMVQTLEQYEFLHKALVHTLTFNCGALRAEDFEVYLRDTSERELKENFELLNTVMDEETPEELQARRANGNHGDKNRKKSDIPGDKYRPRLYICRNFNSSDYINAVYVNGFKKKNQYIIAQSPLPETVFDFICLIYQENCYCVVSMEDPGLIGTEIGDYLGIDNQTLTFGSFTVKSSRCDSMQNYVLRTLNIKNKDKYSSGERVVYHYQMNIWKNNEKIPTDAQQFAQCVKDVSSKAGDMLNEQANILVHCLNGAKRSGLFCAVGIILEKIETEGQVSVPNTLRQLRTRRKKAIPNKEQFEFCFRSVYAHLDLNNTYSNIV